MTKRPKTTMSVREMGNLLGLKKVDSYWLVHKGFFETILVGGKMRVVIESFENWYAHQTKYHKVTGEPPGELLKQESYSARDIAGILGVSESYVYEIMKADGVKPVIVDFRQRFRRLGPQRGSVQFESGLSYDRRSCLYGKGEHGSHLSLDPVG